MQMQGGRRAIWGWAFNDWANSAFSTTVMAGFFPVFFKEYWSAGITATTSTLWLGVANSLSSVVVVILAPVLGSIADSWSARKRFLAAFTFLGVAMTAALPLAGQGEWELAALFYLLATIGFSGSLGFYDSLLLFVAPPDRYDRVSALGYAVGYIGGGLLFAVNVWMTVNPVLFGLSGPAEAVKLSFLTVAIWWAVFTLPLFWFVPEPSTGHGRAADVVRQGLRQLGETFRHVRRLREAFLFLVSYWLYIDAVGTIIRMAVDYGLALGFAADSLLIALLITQFVGIPAAIAFGRIGERLGARNGIYIALVVYSAVVIWAAFMKSVVDFYAMAVVIGLVQGGLQSLSRSLYARLVPPDKSGEFFGFFNMMGKFAAVLGPVLVGIAAEVTGSSRASLLVLLALFGFGAWLLAKVDVEAGRRAALNGGPQTNAS